MSFLAGLGGLLGGLGGLFGKKGDSAYKQTRDAMIGQAETARVAGEKYGFNPLTLLGASSPLGSNRGDGAPPLARSWRHGSAYRPSRASCERDHQDHQAAHQVPRGRTLASPPELDQVSANTGAGVTGRHEYRPDGNPPVNRPLQGRSFARRLHSTAPAQKAA